jgi:hypothetical protein
MPWPHSTPGKDPVPIVQQAGWAPGPVWTGAENLASTGIRSPDRPAHSQLLYRLSYPAIYVYSLVHMYHTMKICVGMGLKRHIFITLTLGCDEWSIYCCNCFTHLMGEQMDLRSGLDVLGDLGFGSQLSNPWPTSHTAALVM